jgi:lysine 2,3-aminomutase
VRAFDESLSVQSSRLLPIKLWEGVSVDRWNDWRWQLANRISSLREIRRIIRLTPEEEAGIEIGSRRFRLEITPYFANLINPDDPTCPIRKQVIPIVSELNAIESEAEDPLAEAQYSPAPGIIHRYPDRVLFYPTAHCASYCRFCTRSRIVGHVEETLRRDELEQAFAYLRAHHEVRDVVVSGGDPLTIGDNKLEQLIATLRSIAHIEIVRLHTRVPVFLPQRVTPALAAMLKTFHPIYISIHFNHPREITREVTEACASLADAGIPLAGQTVLLRGVNDDIATMKRLMHELLKIRVRPYYLNQGDLVAGTSHLRAGVATGLAIMEQLRGHTTGLAVPTYVIDTPHGGGKVPITPNYVISQNHGRILLRNFRGEVYEYPCEDDG